MCERECVCVIAVMSARAPAAMSFSHIQLRVSPFKDEFLKPDHIVFPEDLQCGLHIGITTNVIQISNNLVIG